MKRILAVLGIMSLASAVAAQTYPTRVIRYVVSDAPGSGLDALARIIAEALSAQWGQQVVIDNRPGAGGNIGAEVIARATPDGYTIGQIATTHAVNATLYRTLGYDLVRDLTGITQLASVPSIAVTPSSSQIRTIADLVKAAKAQPGALTYASAGTGTCTFLAGELFKRQAMVDILHVAYKGGRAGGHLDSVRRNLRVPRTALCSAAHGEAGETPAAGAVHAATLEPGAGVSDDRRSRCSGLPVLVLVRPRRTVAHAARNDCNDLFGSRQGSGRAGGAEAPERSRLHSLSATNPRRSPRTSGRR